jgi:hypothetical protein
MTVNSWKTNFYFPTDTNLMQLFTIILCLLTAKVPIHSTIPCVFNRDVYFHYRKISFLLLHIYDVNYSGINHE